MVWAVLVSPIGNRSLSVPVSNGGVVVEIPGPSGQYVRLISTFDTTPGSSGHTDSLEVFLLIPVVAGTPGLDAPLEERVDSLKTGTKLTARTGYLDYGWNAKAWAETELARIEMQNKFNYDLFTYKNVSTMKLNLYSLNATVSGKFTELATAESINRDFKGNAQLGGPLGTKFEYVYEHTDQTGSPNAQFQSYNLSMLGSGNWKLNANYSDNVVGEEWTKSIGGGVTFFGSNLGKLGVGFRDQWGLIPGSRDKNVSVTYEVPSANEYLLLSLGLSKSFFEDQYEISMHYGGIIPFKPIIVRLLPLVLKFDFAAMVGPNSYGVTLTCSLQRYVHQHFFQPAAADTHIQGSAMSQGTFCCAGSCSPFSTPGQGFEGLPCDTLAIFHEMSYLEGDCESLIQGLYPSIYGCPLGQPLPPPAVSDGEFRIVCPNPVRKGSTVSYELPRAEVVRLELFDVQGRRVAASGEEQRQQGVHQVSWDAWSQEAGSLAPGIYFMRLVAGRETRTAKVVILRE
jgi:hypothetical protein